ncbi:MAG: thioredoxin family protein [Hydrogenovibrio sp.]|uniref:thioredoxin family protein n=1 Tax=Hydrogenovibrio sp. TaxID=2065821 RepID=UPI0028709DA2|nr:thioredoxin family protein [Hydrogenovibrio sp.]MDR9498587.1 thioredoxin family protein [Hydrogenovibrio sp.]
MKTLESDEQWQSMMQNAPGLVVLYGGANCQVCQVLKPKLDQALAEHFPKLDRVYVDCEVHTALCAQSGVMSLPVVAVYVGGQKTFEAVRTFSVGEVLSAIERPYSLFFE